MITKINVSLRKITVSAMAKSWKHRRFSPCGWKDTVSSCCKFCPYQSGQSILAKWMHWCMPTCRWKNGIILHCNQFSRSYYPATAVFRGGQVKGSWWLRPCLEIGQKSFDNLGPKTRQWCQKSWSISQGIIWPDVGLYKCSIPSTGIRRKINAMFTDVLVSADRYAQMADCLCYHGAIAEAHDRDGCVHLW